MHLKCIMEDLPVMFCPFGARKIFVMWEVTNLVTLWVIRDHHESFLPRKGKKDFFGAEGTNLLSSGLSQIIMKVLPLRGKKVFFGAEVTNPVTLRVIRDHHESFLPLRGKKVFVMWEVTNLGTLRVIRDHHESFLPLRGKKDFFGAEVTNLVTLRVCYLLSTSF